MATNPLLALSGRVPNVGAQINQFADDMAQAQDRERRQTREDALFEQQKSILQDKNKMRSAQDAAQLAVRLQAHVADGDVEGARRLLAQHKQTLGERIAAGEPVNTVQTDEMLAQLDADPEAFRANVDREVQLAERFGLVQPGAGGEAFTLAPGARRFDAQGNLIAESPFKPDTMSPERLQQEIELQRAKAAANPVNTLAGELARMRLAEAQERLAAMRDKRDQAERDRMGAAQGAENAAQETAAQTQTLLGTIDDALALADKPGAAGFGSATLSGIGGTPATNLKAAIDTLQANLAFGTLQEMRNNSPTGGALGAVSERELQLLSSTVASLNTEQSPGRLKKALEDVRRRFERLNKAAQRDAMQTRERMAVEPQQNRRAPSVTAFDQAPDFNPNARPGPAPPAYDEATPPRRDTVVDWSSL